MTKDKSDFLLEEYQQVYEQYRHCDKMSQGKGAVFAVAAFGVFAYVLGKDVTIWTILGAAVVSISLFLYHVLAFKKIHIYKETAIERLREIEGSVNENKSLDCIRFQTEFKKYEERAIGELSKSKKHNKWFRITTLLWTMAGILITLWVVLIIVKICEWLFSLFF